MNQLKGGSTGPEEAGAPTWNNASSHPARRRIRYFVGQIFPLVGMVIIFGGTMLLTDILQRVLVVAVGLFFVEIAVWNLASGILPNSRQYMPLREEIDRFIQLARRLNTVAISLEQEETVAARRAFETTRDDMLEAVQRMVSMAGKEENQPDHRPAVVDLTGSGAETSGDADPS